MGETRKLAAIPVADVVGYSRLAGVHVWADRLDGERRKLGELQVDVVSCLANSLGIELVKAEALRSMRERPKGWPSLLTCSVR
jgi:adenylate cyclase